ncbi:hypothetical protein QTJ16_000646 [Diplocarpon rosae]|uniref:Uncharacterized protein n=1 Tax=Diplocarpon rosae TaxID=946125 RepID=A0AAD9T5B6_9HELO|nr:hypothetical protein QTJ16_000646 [Diplocarpon rosae]
MNTVTNSEEKNGVTDGGLWVASLFILPLLALRDLESLLIILNREIYRDAFLPQPSLRRNKPWERAPVAAHAPRLAGKKIWKKPSSLRSGNQMNENKENAVDAELEKSGNGSRKRMRGAGGKENITMPAWMNVVDVKGEQLGREEVGGSPRKRGWDQDALVVPKKRTNADHIVTPRKALGRVEGNIAAVSGVQSPIKALLNDVGGVEPRRRKSMKMCRRISRGDLVVENSIDAEPMMRRESFDVTSNVEFSTRDVGSETSFTVQAFKGFETSPSVLLQSPVTTPASEEPQTFESFSPRRGSIAETLGEQDAQNSAEEQTTESGPFNNAGDTSVSQQDVVSCLENELSEDDSTVSHNDKEHATDLPNVEKWLLIPQKVTFNIAEAQELSQSTQPQLSTSKPTEMQTTAESTPQTSLKVAAGLSPVAIDKVLDTASPVKHAQTPKSKRKAAHRWGTRRSTRNTRASSTQEEVSIPLVGESQDFFAVKSMTTLGQVNNAEISAENALASAVVVPEVAVEDAELGVEDIRLPSEIKFQNEPESQRSVETGADDTNETSETGKASLEKQHAAKEQNLLRLDEDEVAPENIDQQAEEMSKRVISLEESLQSEKISTPEPKENSTRLSTLQNVPILSESSAEESSGQAAGHPELADPTAIPTTSNVAVSPTDRVNEELRETSTPDPTTTELTQKISDKTKCTSSEQDDTDMLRDFLTRVKANKAAMAKTSIPKRKRSLPHSPIQIPLETVEPILSPSSPKSKDEFDVGLPDPSPTKRRKRDHDHARSEADTTEPRPIRRSGRTRLPGKAIPTALSFIPVRRIGQDGDSTVTLRRNEEKELAALTRVNTRKNKGGALQPNEYLAKMTEEKEDPVARKRPLKDASWEEKGKLSKKKSLLWAEDLVKFHTEEGSGKKAEFDTEKQIKVETVRVVKEKKVVGVEKASVKVGMRSKMTLGMAANGTPAPKRRSRRA